MTFGTGDRIRNLRATVSAKLADDTFAVLARLEGHTPPETEQDWDCVAASQVIRAYVQLVTGAVE